jgi:monoamine oxidase
MSETPRFFEDFEPGLTIRSGARTITETDIVVWSGIAGDWNAAHVDLEHVKTTPFGQRIAHGNIAFNLAVTMTALAAPDVYRPEGFVRLCGWSKVRFTAPVFIGDTIRTEHTLQEKRASSEPGTGELVYAVSVINQRDETVLVGLERMLVRQRATSAGED